MPGIFISYRRTDSAGYAGRLHQALAGRFGRDHVVFDFVSIEPGMDFAARTREAVQSCDAMLVVIGPT
jgi:hypothetical protein